MDPIGRPILELVLSALEICQRDTGPIAPMVSPQASSWALKVGVFVASGLSTFLRRFSKIYTKIFNLLFHIPSCIKLNPPHVCACRLGETGLPIVSIVFAIPVAEDQPLSIFSKLCRNLGFDLYWRRHDESKTDLLVSSAFVILCMVAATWTQCKVKLRPIA